uniref:Polycomb group RING finger protein 1 n=1 Tax=Strigops habroptila TaxID=2489341 RepID=A0A672UPE7_STRHB
MASPPQGGPMAIAMRLRNQLQAVYKMDPLRNEEEVKVKMKELNEHIVCCLCAGYFIDATTITECLHTFCKSCIVKYLQTSKYCPMCNTKIHETQPLLNLKLDRVMQDIVYKLVPGLQESEEKRIREFYQSRGLDRVSQPCTEDPVGGDPMGLPYSTFDHSRAHYFRYDEHVSLCLEKQSSSKDKSKAVLQHKYVRCSVRAQIRHLRRVLCHRLGLPLQHVSAGTGGVPFPGPGWGALGWGSRLPGWGPRVTGWGSWVPVQRLWTPGWGSRALGSGSQGGGRGPCGGFWAPDWGPRSLGSGSWMGAPVPDWGSRLGSGVPVGGPGSRFGGLAPPSLPVRRCRSCLRTRRCPTT